MAKREEEGPTTAEALQQWRAAERAATVARRMADVEEAERQPRYKDASARAAKRGDPKG